MSDIPQRGTGRFTTFFTTIPAGDVQVRGVPQGATGSRYLGQSLLSSIAAAFTISPDTARLLPPAPLSIGMTPRRFMPRRPASESEAELEFLSAGE